MRKMEPCAARRAVTSPTPSSPPWRASQPPGAEPTSSARMLSGYGPPRHPLTPSPELQMQLERYQNGQWGGTQAASRFDMFTRHFPVERAHVANRTNQHRSRPSGHGLDPFSSQGASSAPLSRHACNAPVGSASASTSPSSSAIRCPLVTARILARVSARRRVRCGALAPPGRHAWRRPYTIRRRTATSTYSIQL